MSLHRKSRQARATGAGLKTAAIVSFAAAITFSASLPVPQEVGASPPGLVAAALFAGQSKPIVA